MTRPVSIYNIFYGSWNASSPLIKSIENLVTGISSTAYWDIMRQYVDSSNTPVTSSITYGGGVLVDGKTSASGLNWKTDVAYNLVYQALVQGTFPPSEDSIYYVILTPDVTVPGLCTQFCGYHSYFTVKTNTGMMNIKFSLIGSPAQCPNGCSLSYELYYGGAFPASVPNTMTPEQIVVHELVEALTDPIFTGYVDNTNNQENADMCNTELSDVHIATNNTLWNIVIGGQNYLLASNYNLKTGICDMGTGSAPLSVNGPLSQWSTAQTTVPPIPPFPPSPPLPPAPPGGWRPPPPLSPSPPPVAIRYVISGARKTRAWTLFLVTALCAIL